MDGIGSFGFVYRQTAQVVIVEMIETAFDIGVSDDAHYQRTPNTQQITIYMYLQ